MKELWPVLAGGVIALAGGYLGAHWSTRLGGKQQRLNLLFEQSIMLDVELLAYVRDLRRRLPIDGQTQGVPLPELLSALAPPAYLSSRVELLGSAVTKIAWSRFDKRWREAGWRTGGGYSDVANELHLLDLSIQDLDDMLHLSQVRRLDEDDRPSAWRRFWWILTDLVEPLRLGR
ncbi:hypothetical protein [Micromonospora sp. WMMD737]|uniref:hypothetical protein n=1 Tax=Micromonospora sp. WMMD737 TaxID=3404113 RepID=UPI003B961AB5